MSNLLVPSTESNANAFPQLSQEMVDRSLPYGAIEHHAAGDIIYARGIRGVDFMIVLRGSVLITSPQADGNESIITIHREREFTGEMDLFNDREALVTARAATETDVLRISHERFREFTAAETDISDMILRAVILRRLGLVERNDGGVVVLGSGRNNDTLRLQQFLSRNGYPYRFIDSELDDRAKSVIDAFCITPKDWPVVISGAKIFRQPAITTLSEALGISEEPNDGMIFDVAVVGGGPAGLAAAVYAASEGLRTIVIEGNAPGGQAGTSSRIENYLGFPSGISGLELASRAQVQAQKFGAQLAVSRNVVGIDCSIQPFRLMLEEDASVLARAVVVASGARYRRLMLPGYEKFEMDGIHYSATAIEARLCTEKDVVVVGGGNSAGQAAVYLASFARHVHMVIRGSELAASMSEYLVQRIANSRHITLHANTEITGLRGDRRLQAVICRDRLTGIEETHEVGNLFVMIGADPCTEWLRGCVDLDDSGFVRTGYGAEQGHGPYRASRPGIFAVGDVRSGSVKRVASGVGEGSVVVADIHTYLRDLSAAPPQPPQ